METWYALVHTPEAEMKVIPNETDAPRTRTLPWLRPARWNIVADAEDEDEAHFKLQQYLTGRAAYTPDRTLVIPESAVNLHFPELLRQYKTSGLNLP